MIKQKAIIFIHTRYRLSCNDRKFCSFSRFTILAKCEIVLGVLTFVSNNRFLLPQLKNLLVFWFSSSLRIVYASRNVRDDYGKPIYTVKAGSNFTVAEILLKIVKRSSDSVIGCCFVQQSIWRCLIRELSWHREWFVTGKPKSLNHELLTSSDVSINNDKL